MIVLGINTYHPDASAAILLDGKLVAAVEEERFTRVKHTADFPAHAVRYCLTAVGAQLRDLTYVAVPRNPKARLAKKLLFALRLPRFAAERLRVAGRFRKIDETLARSLDVDVSELRASIHRVEHHRAHLASSFFVSPFERAAVLSLDGLGDFGSGMWGIGEGPHLRVTSNVSFPHSLGLFYTAITQYLGFPKYGDEYKVMGLASYGSPEFLDEFRRIIQLRGKLGYALNLKYFSHHREGTNMSWIEGEPVLGRLFSQYLVKRLGPPREPRADIERRHENLAATLQAQTEELIFGMMRGLAEATGLRSLAYAGGVAYNCVANGKAPDQTPFETYYIQPCAGDGGLALGAAFYVWHQVLGKPREFVMHHAYWGPEFSEQNIRKTLQSRGLRFRHFSVRELTRVVATHIADGKVVGWFQGRMEWGPRALGNRSIVVDPRRPDMKDILNRRVKNRESFRPFAPSVLEERMKEWFEGTHPSPFMLMAYRVRPKKRDLIPATTHVDGTGRLQTVTRSTNPLYWALIHEFEKITGVPALLNTSFNENEPIVNTPDEAVDCFLRTQMDVLAIGPFVAERPSEDS